jgi:hypothetical protein
MRTRRSPRNQERLWRALGGSKPKTRAQLTAPLSDAEIDAIWWIPKASRSLMKREARKRKGGTS